MILYGYLTEVIILFLWYKLIIKKEITAKTDGADKILGRTIKLVIRYKETIKNNILLRIEYKQKKEKEIIKIKRYVENLVLVYAWHGCLAIMGPIMLSIFFQDKYDIFNTFVFVSCIACLYMNQLKEQTQYYVKTLEIYINKVLIPLENCPRIVEAEKDEIIYIQWTKKKIVIAIIIAIVVMVIGTLFIWVEGYIEQNEIIMKILTIITLICILIYSVKKRFKKRLCKNGIEFVDAEYEMIKDDVEKICNMLNIRNVRFKIIEENFTNAFSKINEDRIWEVSVTSQFITKLRKMLEEDDTIEIDDIKTIFLVTVGHELGHVFYKDATSTQNRLLISFLITLGSYFIGILMLAMGGKSFIYIIIGIILLFLDWIFGGVMCDKRYWTQISELKADRIAIKYVYGGRKAFESFWLTEDDIQKEENSTQEIVKENALYKYYKRNIEIEEHPSKMQRKKLIKERDEWKWWEYFEHALVIRKWRFLGLGWNGVLKVTKV